MEPAKEAQLREVLRRFRTLPADDPPKRMLEELEELYGRELTTSAWREAAQQYMAMQQQQPRSQQHQVSTLEQQYQHYNNQSKPAQHGHVQTAPPQQQPHLHQTGGRHSTERFIQIVYQVLVRMDPTKEARHREMVDRFRYKPAHIPPRRMLEFLQALHEEYAKEPSKSAWREAAQQWRAMQQRPSQLEREQQPRQHGVEMPAASTGDVRCIGDRVVLSTTSQTCTPQHQAVMISQPAQASVPPCVSTAQEQQEQQELQEGAQFTGWQLPEMQQALLNLTHAATCIRVDDTCLEGHPSCNSSQEALDHMERCRADHCQLPNCATLRWLVEHQLSCTHESCTLCAPVRETFSRPACASWPGRQADVRAQQLEEVLQQIRQDAQQQQQALAQEYTPGHAATASDTIAQGRHRVASVLRARLEQRKQQRERQQQPHREQDEEQRERAVDHVTDDLSKLSIEEQVAAIEGDTQVQVSEAAARRRTDNNHKKKERRRQQKQKRQVDDGSNANADQSEEQSSERQVKIAPGTITINSSEETPHFPHSSASGGSDARVVREVVGAEAGAQVAHGEVVIRGEEGRDEEEEKEMVEESEDVCLFEGAPDNLLCPVSMVLLTDPVVAPDGRTYQREALQQCIDYAAEKKVPFRSPVTGLPMAPAFFPNVVMRSQALEYIQRKIVQRTT